VAFSFAKGIFHLYYVSLLAPFAAALFGATAGHVLSDGRAARLVAPLALGAGMVTELVVLNDYPGQLTWLRPLLIAGTVLAAAAVAYGLSGRWRALVLSAASRRWAPRP
jgi:4-amino-4-deoxy-L-arabinose transferase-like glycosyltransferase